MHVFADQDVNVDDAFANDMAEKYIAQRSETRFDLSTLDQSNIFINTGFNHHDIERLIRSHAAPQKSISSENNARFRDIYRSDLGELLMTTYFEETLPSNERFRIPLKNISNRELAEIPGRGLDAIGYNAQGVDLELLLGEAKVSEESASPPQVVNTKRDSIYKTQNKHRTKRDFLIRRLTDYLRRLNHIDAQYISAIIIYMSEKQDQKYKVVYGCALVRDSTCANKNTDYGHMKGKMNSFNPGRVVFNLFVFDKPIQDVVDIFHKKVIEMCQS